MTKQKDDPIRMQMRAARLAMGLSLEKAGEKTGINGVAMGSWERGHRDPPLHQLRRWVAAFGRTLVVLEPDQIVVSADTAGEEYITWHVVLTGGHVMDTVSRPTAEAITWQIPGSRVGYRINRRGQLEYGSPGGSS